MATVEVEMADSEEEGREDIKLPLLYFYLTHTIYSILCGNIDWAIDIVGSDSLSFIPNREVNTMQAYCMKCRSKKEMKDPKSITMKNGRPATQGICPVCGTKMFRIGKS